MAASRKPLDFYGQPLPGVDTGELQGKLIVIEGPDAVGRSTQITRLRAWLEQQGHAVMDTGLARGALAGKGIEMAKEGHTLGPITMTLFYATDFADRLENEIIPALRAGFVVLTDRYMFSIIARACARGENLAWLEQVASFALVPHAVYYLRAEVPTLVSRTVMGRGSFDFWESGMDMRFGNDMFDSFIQYQGRVVKALDQMGRKYSFRTIDASKPADAIYRELQRNIATLFVKQRSNGSGKTGNNAKAAKGESAEAKARPAKHPARNGGAKAPTEAVRNKTVEAARNKNAEAARKKTAQAAKSIAAKTKKNLAANKSIAAKNLASARLVSK